jgi:chemotaxis-related protein WspB
VTRLCVIWRLADVLLATDVRSVVEVLPPIASWHAPATPPWVRGLFSYRGKLIPLVDVARLLNLPVAPDRMTNRVMVVRCESDDGMLWSFGLWIDALIDIDRIDFAAAGSHPGFALETARFLGPVVQTKFGPVQQLETHTLLTPEQFAILAQRLKEAAA